MQIQHHSTSQTCLFIHNAKWLKTQPKLQHLTSCRILLFTTLQNQSWEKMPSLHPISPFPPSHNLVEGISDSDNYWHTKDKELSQAIALHLWDTGNKGKNRPNGHFRACTSLLWILFGPLNLYFSHYILEGEGRVVEEKEEIKNFLVEPKWSFKTQKLKNTLPTSAESTRPAHFTFLCSSYFMPELHFEILHGAGCLKHLQQSWKTHVHFCPAPQLLQKWAHGEAQAPLTIFRISHPKTL